MFVRAPLHMRRKEKPTRFHRIIYCTYNMLNKFRALLCPSSGARDYMCVITACGVQCLGCWLSEVRCRAAGAASGMRDVARLVELYNIPHSGCRTWCVFVRAPLHMRRKEKPTRFHRIIYCTYNMRLRRATSLILDAAPAALHLTSDNQQPRHCTP